MGVGVAMWGCPAIMRVLCNVLFCRKVLKIERSFAATTKYSIDLKVSAVNLAGTHSSFAFIILQRIR